jgi:nucleoside-diphosphate-sugar epimerase
VNLATHIPIGYAAALPWTWRVNDRLRTRGVGNVVAAAQRAGVRRLVQESVSFVVRRPRRGLGHRAGPDRHHARDRAGGRRRVARAGLRDGPRVGVVLRLGTVVGDDRLTEFQLHAVRHGRPVGIGRPDAWSHLVHTDDLGPAVLAALHAPSGVYNVGAEPVRRRDVLAAFAKVAGVQRTGYLGPVLRRLAGPRMEPLSRSLRICSEHFSSQTGWAATRPTFGVDWLDSWRSCVPEQTT